MENYEVKNVKTFTGREGQGFECTLYRNGKSVAKVVNTADGGEIDIYWNDTKAGRVEINTINYMEEPHTYNGTPEEKILMEYLLTIPKYPCLWEEGKFNYYTAGIFLEEMVENFMFRKDIIRKMKTKVIFRLPTYKDGEYNESMKKKVKGHTFTFEQVKEALIQKNPETTFIFAEDDIDAFMEDMGFGKVGGVA